jgi:hypothetical protein
MIEMAAHDLRNFDNMHFALSLRQSNPAQLPRAIIPDTRIIPIGFTQRRQHRAPWSALVVRIASGVSCTKSLVLPESFPEARRKSDLTGFPTRSTKTTTCHRRFLFARMSNHLCQVYTQNHLPDSASSHSLDPPCIRFRRRPPLQDTPSPSSRRAPTMIQTSARRDHTSVRDSGWATGVQCLLG